MRSLMIRTSDRLIDPPVHEPVDIALVKKNLRFTSTSEDVLIAGWITSARHYFEQATSRATTAALWEYGLDSAPCGRIIELPHPPLLEVEEVLYTDGDGNEQTFAAANYTVRAAGGGSPAVVTDPFAGRGRIELVDGASWPTTASQMNAIRIRYLAGYGGTVNHMPELIKAVHYDLVRHFHARPDGELPMTTQVMLRMFRDTAISTIPLERSAWSTEAWP